MIACFCWQSLPSSTNTLLQEAFSASPVLLRLSFNFDTGKACDRLRTLFFRGRFLPLALRNVHASIFFLPKLSSTNAVLQGSYSAALLLSRLSLFWFSGKAYNRLRMAVPLASFSAPFLSQRSSFFFPAKAWDRLPTLCFRTRFLLLSVRNVQASYLFLTKS